jgi:hypothetical protein
MLHCTCGDSLGKAYIYMPIFKHLLAAAKQMVEDAHHQNRKHSTIKTTQHFPLAIDRLVYHIHAMAGDVSLASYRR